MNYNPIICAIDQPELSASTNLVSSLKNNIGMCKLGLEFFTALGAAGVSAIAQLGTPIFLDLKFHDIPNTVAAAVKSATRLGVAMLTIHTSGGKDMMQAASEAALDEASKLGITPPLLLGVTVLTSMDQNDLLSIGVQNNADKQVLLLAKLAMEAGLGGIVCSSHEITTIRQELGQELKLIVPGIRPVGNESGDQKRTMTPLEAIKLGADYLVIGRPITQAANPVITAKNILDSIR